MDDDISPQKDNKYIVFESQLRELFQTCTTCLQKREVKFISRGTLLRVECSCSDEHRFIWESQPYIGNKPAGNLLLSASILFSGSSPVTTLRMLELMNIKVGRNKFSRKLATLTSIDCRQFGENMASVP